jgi:hypothetical protein
VDHHEPSSGAADQVRSAADTGGQTRRRRRTPNRNGGRVVLAGITTLTERAAEVEPSLAAALERAAGCSWDGARDNCPGKKPSPTEWT